MSSVQDFRIRSRLYRLGEDGGIDPGFGAETAEGGKPPPVGFGDIVSMVCGRSRLGVAIYASGQELCLAIDGKQFDLLRPELRAERITILPFVKKFTIWRDTESLLSFRYLRTDVLDDPHAGTKDILRFVSEVAESRERRLRFYSVWQAVQRGEDVTSDDVRARVEEAVRQS